MRNRILAVWICGVAALFVGQSARADGAKTAKKSARTDESRGVASVAESASRLSSISGGIEVVEASEGSAAGGGNNNTCSVPQAIVGTGEFAFDNSAATQDGPDNAACNIFGQSQIDHDVWFCWTAPSQACAGTYAISTCGRTTVDTRIAVYNGCGCPTAQTVPVNCRDDDCEAQTKLTFDAVPGQQYMIRLGTYPSPTVVGGTGTFLLSCELDPPCDEPLSHCQSQDQSDAITSNRTGFIAADGFTPTQSGNINSVCWWGAYLNSSNQNCEATSTDSFRIRYFNDVNGLPSGAPIATFSQPGSLTLEAPFSTGQLIDSGGETPAAEYEFHATHTNVPVVGGNCYWIEITNQMTGCTWFWESGLSGDGRALQDGKVGPPPVAPNGYDASDAILADLAFCTNLAIVHDGEGCLPPAPANDACTSATVISGPGTRTVDTAAATSVGPDHPACLNQEEDGIDRDVWYRWTSTCSGNIVVRTCNTSSVDTKIAVYSGTTCPNAGASPVECNDDLCGVDGFQSMVVFPATVNQQFLIRVGSFPGALGGSIGLEITCGAPNNAACGVSRCLGGSNDQGPCTTDQNCPGNGDCVAPSGCCAESPNLWPACAEESCCELVCACDPFCCSTVWDADCASQGFGDSGCGARALCDCGVTCGIPTSGDCCDAHGPGQPGCDNETCCESVCACDSFCCDTEWDLNCAGPGFINVCQGTDQICDTNANCPAGVPCVGCGADALCSSLCSGPVCPANGITSSTPANCSVDARRPHLPSPNQATLQGYNSIVLTLAAGCTASAPAHYTVTCNPAGAPCPTISNVNTVGQNSTVTFNSVIPAGKWTCVRHNASNDQVCIGTLPGDASGNRTTAPADILDVIDNLNSVRVPPLTLDHCDLDRSNLCAPADIITLIDMLNGANGFIVWNAKNLAVCPSP